MVPLISVVLCINLVLYGKARMIGSVLYGVGGVLSGRVRKKGQVT